MQMCTVSTAHVVKHEFHLVHSCQEKCVLSVQGEQWEWKSNKQTVANMAQSLTDIRHSS